MKEYIRIFNNDEKEDRASFMPAKKQSKPVRSEPHFFHRPSAEKIVFISIDNPDDPTYRWRSPLPDEIEAVPESRVFINNTVNQEPYSPGFSPHDFSHDSIAENKKQYIFDVQPASEADEEEEIHFQEIYNFNDIDSAVEAAKAERKPLKRRVVSADTGDNSEPNVQNNEAVAEDIPVQTSDNIDDHHNASAEEFLSEAEIPEDFDNNHMFSEENENCNEDNSSKQSDDNILSVQSVVPADESVSLDDIFESHDEDDEDIIFIDIDNTVIDNAEPNLETDSVPYEDTADITENGRKKKKFGIF